MAGRINEAILKRKITTVHSKKVVVGRHYGWSYGGVPLYNTFHPQNTCILSSREFTLVLTSDATLPRGQIHEALLS